MKQTMRLPLPSSALSLPPSQAGLGRPSVRHVDVAGGARLNKDISCETPPRFVRFYDPERNTDHAPAAAKERKGRGRRGRAGQTTSLADLYRLRDRNSDALHSFMCVVCLGRLGRTTAVGPFYFFFSRRNCFYAPPFHSVPPLPLYVISGKGKKTHDAENINERRRRGTALRPK